MEVRKLGPMHYLKKNWEFFKTNLKSLYLMMGLLILIGALIGGATMLLGFVLRFGFIFKIVAIVGLVYFANKITIMCNIYIQGLMDGERYGIRQLWDKSTGIFWGYFGYALGFGLMVFIPAFVLVFIMRFIPILGLIFAIALPFFFIYMQIHFGMAPVIKSIRAGIGDCFTYNRNLVRGNSWGVFGAIFILGLISVLLKSDQLIFKSGNLAISIITLIASLILAPFTMSLMITIINELEGLGGPDREKGDKKDVDITNILSRHD